MKLSTTRSRAEVQWAPSHIYECTGGHHIEADAPVAQCPCYRRGEACDGQLVQVGPGGGKVRAA